MQTDNRHKIIWFDNNTFCPLSDNRFRHKVTHEEWIGVSVSSYSGEACGFKLAQDLYAYYGVNAPEQSLFKSEEKFFALSPPLPKDARLLGSSPFPTQPTLGRILAVAEFLQEDDVFKTLYSTAETLLKISSRAPIFQRKPRHEFLWFHELLPHQKIDFLKTIEDIVATDDAKLERLLLPEGVEIILDYLKLDKKNLFEWFQERRNEFKKRYDRELSSLPASSRQLSQAQQKIDALHQQLFYYIPPRVNPIGARPYNSLSWEEALPSFLQNRAKKVLLLKGDPGAGKSLALLKFKFDSLYRYPTLHLELKRYHQDTVVTEITQALRNASYSVLLLDGYDEIAGGNAGNLYERSQLSKDYPSLKVIISCRTQFLSSNYQSQFAPGSLEGLDEYSLAPFGDQEIQAYLEKYTRKNPQVPLRQYQETFEKISGLKTLVQTPLLLWIACEAFPRLEALRKINRSQLYEAFFRQWFANQAQHLRQSSQLELLNAPAETFFDFSKKLALRMADQNTVEVAYNPLNPMDKRWADFFGETPELRLLREGCPLKCIDERYSFVHKSFLDYFIARGIWDALSVPYNESWRVYQLGLDPSFILRDPAVITFLQEMQPDNLEPLVTWITRTQEDRSDSAAHASACAATVLNALQIGFGRYNFQGTRLPYADLEGAFLTGTNFAGADLSYTRLNNAHLSLVKLEKARLYCATLGQLPRIVFDEEIQAIAWHPIQSEIIAVTQNKTIVLWNLKTQCPNGKTLTGHTEKVNCLSFSPDGHTLASGSLDHTLRLWDPATGRLRQSLTGHGQEVNCLAFSPDGRTLASGSGDNTLRLWDLADGRLRQSLTGHFRSVRCLAFSPDGRTLASGGASETLRLWDPADGRLRQSLTGHGREVVCLAFSPDGRTFASGDWHKTLCLWDSATDQLRQSLTRHFRGVRFLAFSPDGRTLASGSGDNTLRLWDLRSGSAQPRGQPFTGHGQEVNCLAFSPDGRTLASGSSDRTLRLWEPANGRLRQSLTEHFGGVRCLAFSPDGRTLASGSSDHTLRLWEPANGQLRQSLTGHGREVTCLAFSPDGRTLASGSGDNTLRLWDLADGRLRQSLTGHTERVTCLAFSPDGRTLASGGGDENVRLWDSATGQLRQSLTGHFRGVQCLTFSPDGRTLAASGRCGNTLCLWDPATRRLRQSLKVDDSIITCLAFSPDGGILASGHSTEFSLRGAGYSLCLWGLKSQQNYQTLPLPSQINTLAFNPISGTLVVGLKDGNLLWLYPRQTEVGTSYFPYFSNRSNTFLSFERAKIDRVRDLTPRRYRVMKQLEATGEPTKLLPSDPPISPTLTLLQEFGQSYMSLSKLEEEHQIKEIVEQNNKKIVEIVSKRIVETVSKGTDLSLRQGAGIDYLAELQLMEQKNVKNLDGQTFLSLRILSYVELWLKLNAEAYPKLPPGVMKRSALEVLQAEIDQACKLLKENKKKDFEIYRQQKLETRMEKPMADYLFAEEIKLLKDPKLFSGVVIHQD